MAKSSRAATPNPEQQGSTPPEKKAKSSVPAEGGTEVYEEWNCQITAKTEDGKTTNSYDKLKKVRDVKISEDEAAILNDGVLNGKNNYGKMYFKPQ